jgi:hypothetical protein
LSDVERTTPAANGSEYILRTSLVLRESTSLISTNRRKPSGKRTSALRS